MIRGVERRTVVLVTGAIAFFVLGVAVSRFWGKSESGSPAAPSGVSLFSDAGPTILIDEGSINLLPDASLHIDKVAPPLIDAGPPPAPR